MTIKNFNDIIGGLLKTYSDLLESFFHNIELGLRMRSRSSSKIMELVERLKNLQLSKWSAGFRSDDNYFLIDEMSYKLKAGAEQEFVPYGLDGEVFSDLILNKLTNREEEHRRLLTVYARDISVISWDTNRV